jgi:hypothetical protein
MKTSNKARLRHALATTLAMGASLHGASAWADGTPLGTAITNKATATFTDGTLTDGTPTTYESTSNEVVITVSEVAGISLQAGPIPTVPLTQGQTFYIEYTITNTGNDPTQFFIPGQATLSDSVNFSQDALSDATKIEIIKVDGAVLPVGVFVPSVGGATGALLGAGLGSIRPGKTVTIRVPVKVSSTAPAGSATTVTIGETTPANTALTDTRSLEQITPGSKDISTFDNTTADTTTTGETNATPPTNGIREAMVMSDKITIGSRLQSFATIFKTASYTPGNPNSLTDDVLTYNLALKVEPPTPLPAGLAASDLHGTQLDITGSGVNDRFVLVSDVLPTSLQLAATTPLVTTEANWSSVYSTTPIAGSTALTATWIIGQPPTGTAVTRVGFIYNTVTQGALPQGATLYRFSIATTPTPTFTGGTIANIAQTFGQSQPGIPAPGTSTQLVYDESGDQTSNNGLDGTNPVDPTLPAGGGGITDGVADPTKDGSDPGNNSGTDGGGNGTNPKGGEDTIVTIAIAPLNGPSGQPGATGPTNNNDDYTNKSIVVPPNLSPTQPLTDEQTPPKTFDNTVQNTSSGPQVISIRPIAPTTTTDLPAGTKVTIVGPTSTATYTYDSNKFDFTSGTGGSTSTGPVQLTVPAGGSITYQTIIDLPNGVDQFKPFPVPIAAFIDAGGASANGFPDANELTNITIDRLYTNYLKLFKEARMLEKDGITPVAGIAGLFSTEQPTVSATAIEAALSAAAIPGRIIEYRITYRNISGDGGSGNILLPANNLIITENGSAGSNTWGQYTLDPTYPTPATGSAINALKTVIGIEVTIGGSPINITEYRYKVTAVPPQGTSFFIFQRQIK